MKEREERGERERERERSGGIEIERTGGKRQVVETRNTVGEYKLGGKKRGRGPFALQPRYQIARIKLSYRLNTH